MKAQPGVGQAVASATAVLALVFASFLFRTHFVHDRVFAGPNVRFAATDCWYHVRLVENLATHFPRPTAFDPYAVYPDGQRVPVAPLLDWLIAGASLLLAGGRPDTSVIERVCAYTPPVLGALAVVPVYLLGVLLLNRTAGLLAATLIVISPGHFLTRSLLGYTDHHVLESLLAAVTVLLLAYAARLAGDDLSAGTPANRGLRVPSRSTLTAVSAGVALGCYLLAWIGGALLVGILMIWLAVQFTLDHARNRAPGRLTRITAVMFGVALLFVLLPDSEQPGVAYQRAALCCALVLSAGLVILRRVCEACHAPRVAFPLLFLGVATLAGVALAWRFPGWTADVAGQLLRVTSFARDNIATETEPLLIVNGAWSLARAWEQFTTAGICAVVAMGLLIVRALRNGDSATTLVSVWSVAMIGLTLGQNRFAYYAAVNVAVLAGYLGALVLAAGRRGAGVDPHSRALTGRSGSGRGNTELSGPALALPVTAGVAFILLLILPHLPLARRTAGHLATPHPDWIAALRWLRENTPEPFPDPAAYYARFAAPPSGTRFPYPDSAYGVMASWGYGYWITQIAHRIPIANPGQRGAETAARFFLTEDPNEAGELLASLPAPYVLIESTMPYLVTRTGSGVGRIASLSHSAGTPPERFSETWYRRDADGRLRSFRVFYPAYYRTMLVRLYVFRGRPYVPETVDVLSFVERAGEDGEPFKELVAVRTFGSYSEASRFRATLPPGTARIASLDPMQSCTPLARALLQFELIYQSPTVRFSRFDAPVSHVEIYRYTGTRHTGEASHRSDLVPPARTPRRINLPRRTASAR